MTGLKEVLDNFNKRHTYDKEFIGRKIELNKGIFVESCSKETYEKVKEQLTIYYKAKKQKVENKGKLDAYQFFNITYGIKPEDIIAVGNPLNDISERFLENYIPFVEYDGDSPDSRYSNILRSAICYCKKDYDYKTAMYDTSRAGLVVHESCTSSWLCCLQLLSNPKYVLLYKKQ